MKRDDLKTAMTLDAISRAELLALASFRLHAYTNGRPWFLAWNTGDYPDEAWYVRTPTGSRWAAPLAVGLLVRSFSIPYEGVAEA